MILVRCENCGKEFEIENKYYRRSESKHFFCRKKCSCEYNNYHKSKCLKVDSETFIEIVKSSKTFREIGKKLGYSSLSSLTINIIRKRCDELGIGYPSGKKPTGDRAIKKLTKGEVINSKLTYQRYRSAIREDAEKTFKELDGNYECCICGYNKHIEVAHIKPVSDFSNDDTVGEINNIGNIVPLCPNHHWEFDNNRMSDEDRKKIDEYLANRR